VIQDPLWFSDAGKGKKAAEKSKGLITIFTRMFVKKQKSIKKNLHHFFFHMKNRTGVGKKSSEFKKIIQYEPSRKSCYTDIHDVTNYLCNGMTLKISFYKIRMTVKHRMTKL
jgi:hypothetical protein